MPGRRHDEGFDHHPANRVRALDCRRLQHRWMGNHAALDLKRRDAVAAGLDHIVVTSAEPEVAVLIAREHVAGDVPGAAEDFGRSIGFPPVFLHHPRVAVAADAENALGHLSAPG